MALEVKGRVIATPIKATGMGQNGPWARTTVVIEVESEYPYKLAMENSNKAEEFARLMVGDIIECKCRVSSREYNGKYYTSCVCFGWNIVSSSAPADAAPAEPAAPDAPDAPTADAAPATGEGAKDDDLPF